MGLEKIAQLVVRIKDEKELILERNKGPDESMMNVSRCTSKRGIRGQKSAEMPPNWELNLGENTEMGIIPDEPIDPATLLSLPKLYRYRLLMIFYELHELPPNIMLKRNFSISFKLFGNIHKFKLYSEETLDYGLSFIPIQKIRLFYFFCENDNLFQNYLDDKSVGFSLTSQITVLESQNQNFGK